MTNCQGLVGSPNGYPRLSNEARGELYRYLRSFMPRGWAEAIRDWRPTKIVGYLESLVE